VTESEITLVLRDKYKAEGYCRSPRNIRKAKLKQTFKGRYQAELARTEEKLELLKEITNEGE
jgi:hypothetical protein